MPTIDELKLLYKNLYAEGNNNRRKAEHSPEWYQGRGDGLISAGEMIADLLAVEGIDTKTLQRETIKEVCSN